MTTYTAIPDSEIEPGKPIKATTGLALRDNVLAIQEGDSTAPVLSGTIRDRQVFNSSGSYDLSPFASNSTVLYFRARVWGAGASGGSVGAANSTDEASGGGGGGYCEVVRRLDEISASSVTVTVGAGGAAAGTGSPGGDSDGNDGQDSSIAFDGITYTATGGTKGTFNNGGGPETGGAAGFPQINSSTDGLDSDYWSGGQGGDNTTDGRVTYWGGGGGGGAQGEAGGGDIAHDGGASFNGGNGGDAAINSDAPTASTPGGGGGAALAGKSGAGGNGQVTIEILTHL